MMLGRFKLILVLLLLAATAHGEEGITKFRYDKLADTLTFQVEQISLKKLLASIAIQTQIEVMFDERADRVITMEMENRPLEQALKNLLRQSNFAFRYEKDDAGKHFLVGVMVLPEGENDASNVQPLLHAAGEAFMNAKHNERIQQPQRESALFNKRWQARLEKMPPKIREKVTQHAEERIKMLAEKNAKREARSKEMKEKREAFVAQRRAENPRKTPEEMTPEEYTLHQQRLEGIKQKLSEQ